MNMKRFFLMGVLCFVLVVPMQAWAESFTLNNVTWTWAPSTPTDFTVTKQFSTPVTFNLGVGASSGPSDLFKVVTSDSRIDSGNTYNMTVTFDFTSPLGIVDPIDVAVVVQKDTDWAGQYPDDNLSFTFGVPVYATWGNGGKLKVDVADVSWSIPWYSGNENYYIPFTVTYTQAPAAVPEPTTMLLLGLGLIGVAGIRKFKKQ